MQTTVDGRPKYHGLSGWSPPVRSNTSDTKLTVIDQAEYVKPDGSIAPAGDLLILGSRLVQVGGTVPSMVRRLANVIKPPTGTLVSPGLIEQHFHGGRGVNFNVATVEDMQQFVESLPRQGITRIMPTVMTGSEAEMRQALTNLEKLKHHLEQQPNGIQMIGIKLEGPFINEMKRGAHDSQYIRDAWHQPMSLLQSLLKIAPDIKEVTLAAELDPEGKLTQFLTQRGIRVSLGHTDADSKQAAQAFEQGATGMTHTFNAMNGMNHRNPGPIPVALQKPGVYPEIIADGHHVDPLMVNTLLQSKPNSILVSDSMLLSGLPEGSQAEFGGQLVQSRNGTAVNERGVLAGSLVSVTDCLRNVVRWGLLPFSKAIQLASRNPADYLGLPLGRVAPFYPADLVFWNRKTMEVEETWIQGKQAYKKSSINAKSQTNQTPELHNH